MTVDELALFSGRPAALTLYERLRAGILARWPDVEVRAARTQITFRERYGFAFVSTRRMGRACPAEGFIILSFGLGRRLDSPRLLAAVEPYPGRWTHHVCVSSAEQLDGELFSWLAEARAFALVK